MIDPASDEDASEASVAGDIGPTLSDGEVVDALAVDIDDREPHEAGQWLEPARHREGLAHVGAKHLVAVEVRMVMPPAPHSGGLAWQRVVATRNRRIELDGQAEVEPEEPGPAHDEGQIETTTVPRDQHAGGKVGERPIQRGQEFGLVAIEHQVEPVATQRDRNDRRSTRVEAIDGGVGLDVEADERKRTGFDGLDRRPRV